MFSVIRKFRDALFVPVNLSIWIFATVVVGFSGPFGSYMEMAPLVRLAYWGAVIAMGIAVMTALRFWVAGRWPLLSFRGRATLISLAFAAVFTPLLKLTNRVILRPEQDYDLPVWQILPLLFGISLGIHLVYAALSARSRQATPRLLRRLPETLRAPVIRLTAHDHFVEIVTEKGSHQIRMRLIDAIEEMEGVDGLCVHRSHWVAIAAVTGGTREGGRAFVVLRDGGQVPVGRKYRDAVAARGLI